MILIIFMVTSFAHLDLEDVRYQWKSDEPRCTPYKNITTNGFCYDILKDKLTNQNPESVERTDRMIRQTYELGSIIIKSLDSRNYQTQTAEYLNIINKRIEENCPTEVKEEIRKSLASVVTTEQSLRDTYKCAIESKWIFCNFMLKTCLRSHENPSYNRSSWPCYDEVSKQQSKSYCKYGMGNFSTMMYKIHKLCPVLFKGFNFNSLNKSDIMHIEGCQKKSIDNENEPFTDSCYKYTGEHYNGTISTTISGKPCKIWRKIELLHPLTYPELQENYCRNPQSYGERPWCYTDLEKRTWEYCNVKKCIKDAHNDGIVVVSVTGILVLLMLTLIIFVIVIFRQRRHKKNKKDAIDITPYAAETTENLLEMKTFMNESFAKAVQPELEEEGNVFEVEQPELEEEGNVFVVEQPEWEEEGNVFVVEQPLLEKEGNVFVVEQPLLEKEGNMLEADQPLSEKEQIQCEVGQSLLEAEHPLLVEKKQLLEVQRPLLEAEQPLLEEKRN